ncbi:MAG: PRC-barrel domain-containing protein [Clostridia bacterium]|nr:PRC-barrel domain-containing protein [Clostridia bacterium]
MGLKSSCDFIGLPVISIDDSREVGSVKALVIDFANAVVCAIAVEGDYWFDPPRVVPFSAIQGIGDAAVTIQDTGSLVPLSSIPEVEEQARANVRVRGVRVFTDTGAQVGTVSEFLIDCETGYLVGFDIPSGSELIRVPRERLISLGQHVMVIRDMEGDDACGTGMSAESAARLHSGPIGTPSAAHTASSTAGSGLSEAFSAARETFLVGRTAAATIRTDDGIVIIHEGDDITPDTIASAKSAGRFEQLVNTVKARKVEHNG